MVHASWDLDSEGGSWLTTIIDPLTSPRRGGPRMVDPAEIERAKKITDDPRSNEQIASDGLLQLLHAGVNADPTKPYKNLPRSRSWSPKPTSKIIREGNNYWLIPPPRLDPQQTPIPLQTKSLLIRKLQQDAS